jgi:hypothetical protein
MICTNFPNLENRGVAANMPDAAKRALDLFIPPPHKGSAPHFLELARHRTSSGWLIKRFALLQTCSQSLRSIPPERRLFCRAGLGSAPSHRTSR